jgi:hypothetical protein
MRGLLLVIGFFCAAYFGEMMGVNHYLKDVKEKCVIANQKYKDLDPDKDSDAKYEDAAMWEQACIEALEELRYSFDQ